MRIKKFLVTGTAGFIGFYLANKLIGKGFQVVGLDNINDYYNVDLKFAQLAEAGIDKNKVAYGTIVKSKKDKNYHFIQLNLEDKGG